MPPRKAPANPRQNKVTPSKKQKQMSDDEISSSSSSDIDDPENAIEEKSAEMATVDDEEAAESSSDDDDDAVNEDLVDDDDDASATDTEVPADEVPAVINTAEDFISPSEADAFIQHNDIFVVKDEERRTSNLLKRPEVTEILSIRISQIQTNSIVLTDVNGLHDPMQMAIKEFNDRKTPLVLRRRLGKKKCADNIVREFYEFWNVNEMDRGTIFT